MISGNIFTNSIEKLVEAGILKDDARFDIELLKDVYLDKGEEAFIEAVNRRCQGEPVAYILGRQSFYMENYYVEPGVLIPRSDTEILVEAALKAMGLVKFPMGDISKINFAIEKDTYHIADLCTGTGCVGISVANQVVGAGKQLEMILADISDIALNCAEKNVKSQAKTNIKIKKFDVLNGDYETLSDHKLDMILSNPPYITDEEMNELPLDVKDYEPDLALRAKDNGLEFYKALASKAKSVLTAGGLLIVEHGYLQGQSVREIFTKESYVDVMTLKDYGGNERVTLGRFL